MNLSRILALVVVWSFLALAVRFLVPGLATVVEPRTLLFVLALPWLISLAGVSPRELLDAVRDPLRKGAADLPADRRAASAIILRRLGGLSLSAGVFAFFATTVTVFTAIASAGGQVSPSMLVSGAGATLLAPLYGYVLMAFVYEPLAAAIEGEDSGLGAELEGPLSEAR